MLKKFLIILFVFQINQSAFSETAATQETLKKNQSTISSLLAKSGKPNTSTPIEGMSAMLYYDANGVAKTIIMADGTSVTVTEFMNSKDFSDFAGVESEASISERSEDTTPTGSSNLVPENFNGEVNVTTKKNSDGTYNILDGVLNATGGPFDRLYNGVSGSVPVTPPLSDLEYNEKFIILNAQIWGITEVAEKMCRPLDSDFPKSISTWWIVAKNYVEAEKKRDLLIKARSSSLKNTSESLTTNGGGNSSIQLEGLRMQIEALNISIDSLSGSSLYSGDNKAGDVRATSQLAWREALLAATYQGIVDSKAEDAKVVKAYNVCNTGIDNSLKIATKACARTKKVDCNNDSTSSDCNGKTGVIEVNDPVPGSCEMVKTNLPNLTKNAMKDLATLYGISPIPSKEMNERLLRLTSNIKKDVVTNFPKSNDSNYDWTTPLKVCADPLTKPFKLNGMICPSNASEKDYDKSKFENLGKSDDKSEATAASKVYVVPAKEVLANAKLYLVAKGLTESSLDDTANLFMGYWNIDDLYFGQSNIRQTYFKYNQKVIGELVLADRNKLARLLSDRQKLLDMYTNLKKLLDTKSAAGNNSSLAKSGATPSSTSKTSSLNTSAAIDSQKSLDDLGNLKTNFDTTGGSFNPESILALSKISNGLLTFSAKENSASLSTNSGNQQYSIAQNKKINSSIDAAKKLQKVINDTNSKNKNMHANDELQSTSNLSRLASNNMKPNYISTSGIQLLSAIGGLPVHPGDTLKRDNNTNGTILNNSSDLYTSGSSSGSSSSNSGHSSSSSNRSNDTSTDSSDSSNPLSQMGKSINYANLTDDEKKVYDAINARDKENKNKYDKTDTDSIFEQITKAHIRNLDRVQK